ncbi:MAG: hypothetical protein HRU35_00155 [Rickettsiaceae bacterium]|nr:hypothetical protein [Rickettsiaceae bacterium]
MDRYFNSENDYSKDEQDINYFPSEYHSHQEIKDVVNSYINSIGDCKYYDGPIKVLVAFCLNVKSMEEFNQTVCGQSEIYQIDKVTPIDDWANIN